MKNLFIYLIPMTRVTMTAFIVSVETVGNKSVVTLRDAAYNVITANVGQADADSAFALTGMFVSCALAITGNTITVKDILLDDTILRDDQYYLFPEDASGDIVRLERLLTSELGYSSKAAFEYLSDLHQDNATDRTGSPYAYPGGLIRRAAATVENVLLIMNRTYVDPSPMIAGAALAVISNVHHDELIPGAVKTVMELEKRYSSGNESLNRELRELEHIVLSASDDNLVEPATIEAILVKDMVRTVCDERRMLDAVAGDGE